MRHDIAPGERRGKGLRRFKKYIVLSAVLNIVLQKENQLQYNQTFMNISSIFLKVLFVVADSSESGTKSVRDGRGGSSTKVSSDGKPTRVRTVLNEKQLHTLRTCYNANPRPDALMKEQLVEMTSLSPRVIRVWFQNKRCKDKKRAIAMKQQLQQEKVSFTKLQLLKL